jgi:tetratricopeptide (TPR) repeat protein
VSRTAQREQRSAANIAEANTALLNGNATLAQSGFARALSADANHIGAMIGLAASALARGDESAAIAWYNRALEADPKNPSALAGLSMLQAERQTSSRESALRAAVDRDGDNAETHAALGLLAIRSDRWEEARAAFELAVAIEPDHPDYHYNLGVAYDRLRQPRSALAAYQRALALSARRTTGIDPARLAARINTLSERLSATR